jgi:excisionase family DNA binding protein
MTTRSDSPGLMPEVTVLIGELPARGRSRVGRDADVITTELLAARLRMTVKTIRALAARGQIPAMQMGKNWRYSYQAVIELLARPPGHPHHQAPSPLAEPRFGQDGSDLDILTSGELADRWGVTPPTIRNMAALDQIPAARLGKNWRYSYQAVTEALKRHHDNLTANDPGDLDDAGTEPYAEPDAQPPTWPAVCPACGQLTPR